MRKVNPFYERVSPKPTSRTGLGLKIWDDWLWRLALMRMVSESRTYVDCLNLHLLGAGR